MTTPPTNPIPSLQKALDHRQEYVRQRAQIILLTLDGAEDDAIAEEVGVSPRTVAKWQNAWMQDGLWIFPQEVFTDEQDIVDDVDEDDDDDDGFLPLDTDDDDTDGSLAAFVDAPGLHPDDSMAEAARKLMLYNLAQMAHYRPIALDGTDIEGVHKMRVATRRLRNILEMFVRYIDTESYRVVQKRLRQTAKRLGEVRDLDVFRSYVAQYVETELSGDSESLLPMFAAIDTRYDKARKRLEKWIGSDKYDAFVGSFESMLNKSHAQLDEQMHTYAVNQMVPRLVYTYIEYVWLHRNFIADADPEQLHAIRLDFKRVRYTLEFFSEVLGPEAAAVIKACKVMQDHLGEINDMYVAAALLREISSELAKPDREAVKAFRKYCVQRAKSLEEDVPMMWETFDNKQTRQALGLAVGAL